MSRRVSLPGASELFGGALPARARPVVPEDATGPAPDAAEAEPAAATQAAPRPRPGRHTKPDDRRSSGRVKHDTKITVYVTEEELLGLEQARLALRAEHGVAADRGRIVREAIDVVLGDFVERGADSVLVQRLNAQ
ncbi:MAG TPA: hypothetical protein VEK80_03745 [Kribbellaceae bacterium]|nr:hypothetical protein [Kribbellaceae bacterium]